MTAADTLSFVWDPGGNPDLPVAVRRYGAHDTRITVELARRLYVQLDGVLLADHAARQPDEHRTYDDGRQHDTWAEHRGDR